MGAFALVKQVAVEDSAVMMAVDINLVVNVRPLKPVKMVNVLEPLKLSATGEYAETTELEDLAEAVLLDRDAGLDNASASTIVMSVTVAMPFNLMELTLAYVPRDPVELAHLVLLVDPMEDVLLKPLAQSRSPSLTALLVVPFHQQAQF